MRYIMITWAHSAAASAGLGPPQWLVLVIILALIFTAGFERGAGAGDSTTRTLVLTRRDKWTVLILVGSIVSLLVFAVCR